MSVLLFVKLERNKCSRTSCHCSHSAQGIVLLLSSPISNCCLALRVEVLKGRPMCLEELFSLTTWHGFVTKANESHAEIIDSVYT